MEVVMPDTIDCPFCNPQERVVKENASAQVMLSDPRKVPGHILVMPKRHVVKPWDLTPQELQDVFELIFFIEQRIIGKLGDGCDVRQNYRPFMQQSALKIDHVHFHVIPRSLQDYIYSVVERHETDLFAELDDEESDAVVKLLK
jgi:diadenosine tetraphosphate (Ap4A) HIT family hydrolase